MDTRNDLAQLLTLEMTKDSYLVIRAPNNVEVYIECTDSGGLIFYNASGGIYGGRTANPLSDGRWTSHRTLTRDEKNMVERMQSRHHRPN